MEILELLESLLEHVTEIAIIGFEFAGVIVIILAGLRAVWDCIKKDHHARIRLGNTLALGLQFLMGGEILHTVVSNSLKDIAVVAALFAVRTGLAFVNHWELTEEKAEEKEEKEEKHE